MEEMFGLLFRLFLFLFEFLLQLFSGMTAGFLLKAPGLLLYKIIWPPNWFKEVDYDSPRLYYFGVLFYALFGVLYFFLFVSFDSDW